MKAVGRFALIKIEETVSNSGIAVKNDGVGTCVSCPEMIELEGLVVVYDTGPKHEEYDGHLIMDNKHIMAVIE